MDDKIVLLDESALDNIVGGAFNKNTVDKLGLEVKTGLSGAQGMYVDISHSAGKLPGSSTQVSSKGWMSDATLRNIVSNYDHVSMSARTTTGEMKSLSKSQVASLLS